MLIRHSNACLCCHTPQPFAKGIRAAHIACGLLCKPVPLFTCSYVCASSAGIKPEKGVFSWIMKSVSLCVGLSATWARGGEAPKLPRVIRVEFHRSTSPNKLSLFKKNSPIFPLTHVFPHDFGPNLRRAAASVRCASPPCAPDAHARAHIHRASGRVTSRAQLPSLLRVTSSRFAKRCARATERTQRK